MGHKTFHQKALIPAAPQCVENMSLHSLAAAWWFLQGKFHGDIRNRLESPFQVHSLMDSYSLGCSGQTQLKQHVF